eukprot:28162-Eustigmatos_ZCMA.PRE.1
MMLGHPRCGNAADCLAPCDTESCIAREKNLDILVHAEVKRVLMRHHGGELEAIGVEYAHEGKIKRVQHVSATYVNGNDTTHPKGA